MAARNIALNWTTPAFSVVANVSQGEDVTLTFTAVTVTSILGWTLTATLKKFHTDSAATLTITPTITDSTNGVFTVALTATQTGTTMAALQTYVMDVWRTNSGSATLLSQVYVNLLENPRVSV